MPDPTLALGVKVPQGEALNPLGAMSQFAQVQNALNQNKLFQQQFAARQRMGELFSQYPMEEAIQRISRDPIASIGAGEAINWHRQAQLALADLQSKELTQNDTVMTGFLKAATGAMSDPEMLSGITKRYISTLPSAIRGRLEDRILATSDGLTAGLEKLPADQRADAYKRRLVAGAVSAGMTAPTTQRMPLGAEGREGLVATGGPLGAEALRVGGEAPAEETPTNALGGRPGGPFAGPSIAEKGYREGRVKDFADYEKNLDDRVNTASSARRNFQDVIDAAKEVELGPGAETKMRLGQMLKAIGVKGESEGIVKDLVEGVAPLQEADKILFANTMNQLKLQLTGVGGSRINQQEFVQSLSKNPSIITDPKALSKIFNLWNEFYDRDRAEQAALDEFKAKGGDVTRWPKVWANSEYMKRFAPGGKIETEGVKGMKAEDEGKPKKSLQEFLKSFD